MRDFEKPIQSGLLKIPEARQIEEIFGTAKHSINNLRGDGVTAEWQTVTLFGGRYELWMAAPVRMTEKFDVLEEVLSAPTFQLMEVVKITNEGRGAAFSSSGNRQFNAGDWAKIYQAKGNFSVVGIALSKAPAIPHFDEYKAVVLRPKFDPVLKGTPVIAEPASIVPTGSQTAQVRGIRSEQHPRGFLWNIDVVPQPDVIVAAVFTEQVRVKDGANRGGGTDDDGTAHEFVHLQVHGRDKPFSIDWTYSVRSRRLTVNNVSTDLAEHQMAIVTFEGDVPSIVAKPVLEEVIQDVRRQLGARDDLKVEPAQPATAHD